MSTPTERIGNAQQEREQEFRGWLAAEQAGWEDCDNFYWRIHSASERQKAGWPDVGAVWHTVTCACHLCLDSDALIAHGVGVPSSEAMFATQPTEPVPAVARQFFHVIASDCC